MNLKFNQLLASLLFILCTTLTFNLLADVRTNQNVIISSDEIVDDDLYIFAETIRVDGIVKGDLIAFGSKIVIDGTVEGDLTAAGQSVTLNGKVSDDVRIAGQVLTLNSNADVGDDLIAAGFSLQCVSGSHIEGEVKYAGYQSIFAGVVDKNLQAAARNCQLDGSFGGNVELIVDTNDSASASNWFGDSSIPLVPGGLTINDKTNIAGNLKYQSPSEATLDPKATIVGEVTFDQVAIQTGSATTPLTLTDRAIAATKHFLALLVVGLIVVFTFPNWTNQVANTVQRRPLASFGWGLLSFIGVIGGAILLLIGTILIAIVLGLVSLESLLPAWLALGAFATTGLVVGFSIFAVWVSKVIVGVWAGKQIFRRHDFSAKQKLLALTIGLLAFVALSEIPYLGGPFSILVTLFGVGSAALWLFGRSESSRGAKSIPVKRVA